MDILEQVRARYSEDPVLMSIVADSEGICARLASGAPAPTATEGVTTATPTP
jgi:hypothetical protein